MENKILGVHVAFEDGTFPAYLHFFTPALLSNSPADGSINEPTEMTYLELPCRTGLPVLNSTGQNLPAGAKRSARLLLHGQQEENLPFDMHRNLPPTLLKCLNRPGRYSQYLSQGFLSFFEFLADR